MNRVCDALDYGRDYLSRCGLEDARREAAVLLAHVLGIDRSTLYAEPHRPLSPGESSAYLEALRRRGSKEPFAYIAGRREFMSLEFVVDRRVLIPRPETEVLVEAVLGFLRQCGPDAVVVDLGTGSGAIAVSIAKLHPGCVVYATDVSRDALEVARLNAGRHGVQHRITFLEGDMFEALEGQNLEGCVNVVVSNPPYVPSAELEGLPPDVRRFEPIVALDGGPGGLRFYMELVGQSPFYLKPGGCLAVEVGAGQAAEVSRIFWGSEKFEEVKIIRDYAGVERVVMGYVPEK